MLCPAPPGDGVQVAAGQIVYPTFTSYAATDLQGVAHALAGVTPRPSQGDIAFDGRTVFVVNRDCDADRLLAVDVAARAMAPAPGLLTRCVVRRSGGARLRVTRHGRVRIRLRCPDGCRGTLRLVEQRRGRRERIVASAGYAHAGGSTVVQPPIASYARALAGCAGGLRVEALLFAPGEPSRRGLGSYRIVARSPCRSPSGPAFTAPQPQPRP